MYFVIQFIQAGHFQFNGGLCSCSFLWCFDLMYFNLSNEIPISLLNENKKKLDEEETNMPLRIYLGWRIKKGK